MPTNGQRPPGFEALSIRPGLTACKAAWLLVGERFLLGQQPALPLPDCDRAQCDCSFNAHDDRREPGERRGSEEDSLPDEPAPERRDRGRRADDRD